jgi:hypothetical protein
MDKNDLEWLKNILSEIADLTETSCQFCERDGVFGYVVGKRYGRRFEFNELPEKFDGFRCEGRPVGLLEFYEELSKSPD